MGAASFVALGACAAPNPAFVADADETGAADGQSTSGGTDGSGIPPDGTGNATDPDPDPDSTAETGQELPDDTSGTSDGPDDSIEFTDDEWTGEFAAGALFQLGWRGDALELSPQDDSGLFMSRVFDAGQDVAWDILRWRPAAPYGKPLPDDGESEGEYPRGAADMSDNVLLLHLDNFEPMMDGLNVLDSSGQGNHGFTDGEAAFDVVDDGAFSRGLRVQGTELMAGTDSYLTLPVAPLAPGIDDFTWSIWFRDTTCTGNGSVLMVLDSPTDAAGTTSIWLSCELCSDGAGVGFAIVQPGGGGQPAGCVAAPLESGRWHHVAMVKSGHQVAEVGIYFDGVALANELQNFTESLVADADVAFNIGGSPDIDFAGSADFDEVAVWQRALSPNEIEALYVRGATKMSLLVRSCNRDGCADDPPFVGPSGRAFPPFVDAPGRLVASEPIALPDLAGRFVQYQVEFGRFPDGVSPELRAVTLRSQ